MFKGTGRRGALDIALELESIGGQWDAFTGKEVTCYHGRVLGEHFDRMADVFSDIILNPAIERDALDLEINVVQEEIRAIDDSPEETTYEAFYRSLFDGDQLGYPVTGSLSDIRNCTRRHIRAFQRKTYVAPRMIVGFVGNLPIGKVLETVRTKFAFPAGRAGGRPRGKAFAGKRSVWRKRPDWSQSHICAGVRTVSASHPGRYPLLVLTNILGGGVSSKMFQSLRENAGLAYSVYSYSSFWTDTGALTTSFSVDPRNLARALDIFHKVMNDVRRGRVTAEELESAKAQLKASVIFGIENVDTRLFRLFHGECYHGGYVPVESVIDRIEMVGIDDVVNAADKHLREADHTYVTCGPVSMRGLLPRKNSPLRAAV